MRRAGEQNNVEGKERLPQWDKDWNLQPMNAHGLVDEYLEMGECCWKTLFSADSAHCIHKSSIRSFSELLEISWTKTLFNV